MMRCPHKNVRLVETADYAVCMDLDADGSSDFYDSGPSPTSTGHVACRDCGAVRRYGVGDRNRMRLPAWVLKAIRRFEAP